MESGEALKAVAKAIHHQQHMTQNDHIDKYKLHMDTAEALIAQKKHVAAEKELIFALAERLAIDEEDSPEIISIMRKLSDVFLSENFDELSKDVADHVDELEQKVPGETPTHQYLSVMFKIAKGAYAVDHRQVAHLIMNIVMKQHRSTIGEKGRELYEFYTTYGDALMRDGVYNEAIEYHKRALALLRDEASSFNENENGINASKDIIIQLRRLGKCFRLAVKYTEAESCFEEVLTLCKGNFLSDFVRLGDAYNDLAETLREMKHYKKSIEYHEAAIEAYARSGLEQNNSLVYAKGNLGLTLKHQSQSCFDAGNKLLASAVSHMLSNKFNTDNVWLQKFQAELAVENAEEELSQWKNRVKKYQADEALHEVNALVKSKKYKELEETLASKEKLHKTELNKIRFANSVLSGQLDLAKSTADSLLEENTDMLEKFESLLKEKKEEEARHAKESKDANALYRDLQWQTQRVKESEKEIQRERDKFFEENQALKHQNVNRVAEIEALERKAWEAQKQLKIARYKNEMTNIGDRKEVDRDHVLATVAVMSVENLSSRIAEDCINQAISRNSQHPDERPSNPLAERSYKEVQIQTDGEKVALESTGVSTHNRELSSQNMLREKVQAAESMNEAIDRTCRLGLDFKAEELVSSVLFSLLEESIDMDVSSKDDSDSLALLAKNEELQNCHDTLREREYDLSEMRDDLERMSRFQAEAEVLKVELNELSEKSQEQLYEIDDLKAELCHVKAERDGVLEKYNENLHKSSEAEESNRLMTLKFKAANYEVEHIAKQLEESNERINNFDSLIAELTKKLQESENRIHTLNNDICQRDDTIQRLEDDIQYLKGLNSDNECDDELVGNNKDKAISTDQTLPVLDEVASKSLTSPRVSFLPSLASPPRPDDKSSMEEEVAIDSSSDKVDDNIAITENVEQERQNSHDFAEVLYLGPPQTPKIPARAQFTKNKEKLFKFQQKYCTLCDRKIRGAPKIIPTSLRNVLPPGGSFESISKLSDGSTLEFEKAGYPKSSKNFLDFQVIWKETYASRGDDCLFCSWDCARNWNMTSMPVNYRYLTAKLIDIAAGKFLSEK